MKTLNYGNRLRIFRVVLEMPCRICFASVLVVRWLKNFYVKGQRKRSDPYIFVLLYFVQNQVFWMAKQCLILFFCKPKSNSRPFATIGECCRFPWAEILKEIERWYKNVFIISYMTHYIHLECLKGFHGIIIEEKSTSSRENVQEPFYVDWLKAYMSL